MAPSVSVPLGRTHLSDCTSSACLLPHPRPAWPCRTTNAVGAGPPRAPSKPPAPSDPTLLTLDLGWGWGSDGGRRGRGAGAVCVNKAGCSRQNPSCRGEAAAFPTDNLMTLAHFHQPNLEHTVGIGASGFPATESNYRMSVQETKPGPWESPATSHSQLSPAAVTASLSPAPASGSVPSPPRGPAFLHSIANPLFTDEET